MSSAFHDDPTMPGRRIWSPRKGPFRFSAGVAAFSAMLASAAIAAMLILPFMMRSVGDGIVVAGIMAALATPMVLMTAYVWRDAKGKRGGTILLDANSLRLDLPAGRSLIHRPPACRLTLPLNEIRSVETRQEVYGAQGGAMLQRPYRVVCRDGSAIFLFEERALATGMAGRSLQGVAAEIAAAAAVQVIDLPMAQGRGGILGAWLTQPPPWDAAAMTPQAERSMGRRVYWTGAFVGVAAILVLIASIFS